MMKHTMITVCALLLCACGGDDDTEADRQGIGAQCATDDDCFEEGQVCLMQFRGGYCGTSGCMADADCPAASACITHDDGANYCFRECIDKPDCNANRSPENEANCVGSVTFVEERLERKACEPPSGT